MLQNTVRVGHWVVVVHIVLINNEPPISGNLMTRYFVLLSTLTSYVLPVGLYGKITVNS